MAKQQKTVKVAVKKVRHSISRMVFALIAKGKLNEKPAKDGLDAVCVAVKREFPKSAFSQTHYDWYRCRFNAQKAAGLALDCLHQLPEATPKAQTKTKAQPKAIAKKAAKPQRKAAGIEKE